jgi:hypothetical protein
MPSCSATFAGGQPAATRSGQATSKRIGTSVGVEHEDLLRVNARHILPCHSRRVPSLLEISGLGLRDTSRGLLGVEPPCHQVLGLRGCLITSGSERPRGTLRDPLGIPRALHQPLLFHTRIGVGDVRRSHR